MSEPTSERTRSDEQQEGHHTHTSHNNISQLGDVPPIKRQFIARSFSIRLSYYLSPSLSQAIYQLTTISSKFFP